MAFTTLCPQCGWTPRLADENQGREASCPECGRRFVARPASQQERAVPGWMRRVYALLTFWR